MPMLSRCDVLCCICKTPLDWHKRYGREGCCCSRECHDEFEWRRTLAIMGKEYRPKEEVGHA
jgi:hypothetical protein